MPPPFRWKDRFAPRTRRKDLCRGQVKKQQRPAFGMEARSKNPVRQSRLPAHQIHDHCGEDRAGNPSWPAAGGRCRTPGEGIPVFLAAGTEYQPFLRRMDHGKYKLRFRQSFQAGCVETDLETAECQRRFPDMGEKFPPDDLISLAAKGVLRRELLFIFHPKAPAPGLRADLRFFAEAPPDRCSRHSEKQTLPG